MNQNKSTPSPCPFLWQRRCKFRQSVGVGRGSATRMLPAVATDGWGCGGMARGAWGHLRPRMEISADPVEISADHTWKSPRISRIGADKSMQILRVSARSAGDLGDMVGGGSLMFFAS